MLTDELADTCTRVGLIKQALEIAPDHRDARDLFEELAEEERLARQEAGRWEDLARDRAEKEDVSPLGHATTFGKRMVPMPHTVGEAAIRLPGIAAGGIAGHMYGKGFEGPTGEEAMKVLSPAEGLQTPGRQPKTAPIVKMLERTLPAQTPPRPPLA